MGKRLIGLVDNAPPAEGLAQWWQAWRWAYWLVMRVRRRTIRMTLTGGDSMRLISTR